MSRRAKNGAAKGSLPIRSKYNTFVIGGWLPPLTSLDHIFAMHVRHIPELVEFHRKRVERLRHKDDLPAPWEVYPDIPCGSIGWRMGPGEDIYGDWLTWLRGLTGEQRQEYRTRHPAPESWAETYELHFQRLARESHAVSWEEFWDAELQRQEETWGPVA